MDDQERDRYLATLAATPARLKEALAGVPKKLLLWTPAPGKWSIQEIVCHMRDMEREAYLERYRRMLAEDNPKLPDVDGDRYAIEKGYRSMKLGEVVRDWSQAPQGKPEAAEEGEEEPVGARGNPRDRRPLLRRSLPAAPRGRQRRSPPGPDRGHPAPAQGPGGPRGGPRGAGRGDEGPLRRDRSAASRHPASGRSSRSPATCGTSSASMPSGSPRWRIRRSRTSGCSTTTGPPRRSAIGRPISARR